MTDDRWDRLEAIYEEARAKADSLLDRFREHQMQVSPTWTPESHIRKENVVAQVGYVTQPFAPQSELRYIVLFNTGTVQHTLTVAGRTVGGQASAISIPMFVPSAYSFGVNDLSMLSLEAYDDDVAYWYSDQPAFFGFPKAAAGSSATLLGPTGYSGTDNATFDNTASNPDAGTGTGIFVMTAGSNEKVSVGVGRTQAAAFAAADVNYLAGVFVAYVAAGPWSINYPVVRGNWYCLFGTNGDLTGDMWVQT